MVNNVKVYGHNAAPFQNEVTEMNRKFKMVVHHINQLKEETAAREALLLKDAQGVFDVGHVTSTWLLYSLPEGNTARSGYHCAQMFLLRGNIFKLTRFRMMTRADTVCEIVNTELLPSGMWLKTACAILSVSGRFPFGKE